MSARDYADALLLSPWALRKWRARLDDSEVSIDWRAHLHPSVRPRISRGNRALHTPSLAPASGLPILFRGFPMSSRSFPAVRVLFVAPMPSGTTRRQRASLQKSGVQLFLSQPVRFFVR
jgi:hypothetical protein